MAGRRNRGRGMELCRWDMVSVLFPANLDEDLPPLEDARSPRGDLKTPMWSRRCGKIEALLLIDADLVTDMGLDRRDRYDTP